MTDRRADLIAGDMFEVLDRLPADSFDACVTDPPYGLEFMGKDWDRFAPEAPKLRAGWDHAGGQHEVGALEEGRGHHPGAAGRVAYHKRRTTFRCAGCGRRDAFRNAHACGAEWLVEYVDAEPLEARAFQAWCEAWAREVIRVLKPGGHVLAFGGTRTYHRMVAGLEDAGFEIRDCLAWCYAQGFPKSLDVAKSIDKRRDDTADVRVVCRWLRAKIDAHPVETVATLADRFGFHTRMVDHWAARDTDSQPTLPTLEQWDQLREVLGFGDELDGEVLRLNLRKGEPGEAWADRPIVGEYQRQAPGANYYINGRDGLRRSDAPALAEAEPWRGWGTALKPAFEPIVLARKPLAGTVAENVLKHGTGALNIDATRLPVEDLDALAEPDTSQLGRWPANLALTDPIFDGDTAGVVGGGYQAGGGNPARRIAQAGDGVTMGGGWQEGFETGRVPIDQRGTYSRFFLIPKADRAEREPIIADGTGERENTHPTVKPLELMRHLVRLVTPPAGVVLDPFLGSGTTALAAELEGFGWCGVERDPEYVAIAEARLRGWQRGLGLDVPAPAPRARTPAGHWPGQRPAGSSWSGHAGQSELAERHEGKPAEVGPGEADSVPLFEDSAPT